MQARRERPTSREISWVRPPSRPFTDSRSPRVCVARGSIAYSAVTQPRPLPLRHRGTPSVTDAAHSTLVWPNSTRTDPSAWSSQSRVIVTARSSSFARPSGRGIRIGALLGKARSDVERGEAGGDLDVAVERLLRLLQAAVPVAPRNQVGQQQPADVGAGGMLAGLLAGEVDVRRVVIGLEIRRLAEEEVDAAGKLDQLVADAGVGAVGEGGAAVADPHAVGLDGVVDAVDDERERADLELAGIRDRLEVVDLGEQVVDGAAERPGDVLLDVAGPVDRQALGPPARVVAPGVGVGHQVE